MCGIFGSPTITPSVARMLPFIGMDMEARGSDAWGASNGDAVVKRVGPLTATWHEEYEDFTTWQTGIFHTRGMSCGANKVANAHPFVYAKADGSQVIGIHNGIISNHDELDKKYKRNCEVDSMHIWMHLAEDRPWTDLNGWGNLAWYETDRTGVQRMNLARFNNDALKVCQLQGGEFVFASTLASIQRAARMVGNCVRTEFSVDEYHHYWFAPDRQGRMSIWRSQEQLPFSHTRYTYTASHGSSGSGSRSTYGNYYAETDGYCQKCGNTRIKTKDQLFCMSCFIKFMDDYTQWDRKQEAAGQSA